MKRQGLFALIIIGTVGMVLGATQQNSFGFGGGSPSCYSVAAGGTALVGEGVVEISNSDGANGDVDALLRLKYKSQTLVFRTHIDQASLGSEDDVLCQVLAANPVDYPDLHGIIEAFGLTGHVLQIGDKSVKGVDNGPVGTTGRSMGIADITIFVE
jgi:hypothetical protein